MEKIVTKKSDINTSADLANYRKRLKQNLVSRERAIKVDLTYKLHSSVGYLFRPKRIPKLTRNGKVDRSLIKKTVRSSVGNLVNRILPKRTGFLKKWLLTFVAKKAVDQLFTPKPQPPALSVPMSSKPLVLKEMDKKKVKEKVSIKGIWTILKDSITGFGEHKVTKISGSLAYYTVFSMAPLMVMVIALCSIFLEKDAAEGHIFAQLKGFLGADTALQLQEIIKKAAIGDKGLIASIIGGVTLLIGATSIFADIQDSINSIWGIKPKPKRGWLKLLQNRFLSFSVIISLGFLLLVSLGVSAVLDGFSERLQARFQDISVILFYILNTLITFGVVTTIFGVIFKVLPDATIRWRDVLAGAMVTAVLFMAGKFGISFYIGQSNVGSTYGAAGSLVILLLWAYYSSIILYFGAEFTKAYAVRYGAEIHPNAYAVTMKEVEVEQGGASVQAIEKSKT